MADHRSSFVSRHLLPLTLFLTTFTLYAFTAPAGLTWDLGGADGGEFATAVYTGGLVHSPGYPTYLLFAQIVHLIPLPSFAHRLNLFSALCMSLSCLVFWHTAALRQPNEQKSRPHSLTTAVALSFFATAPLVWSQAIMTEVYALATLFSAVILYQIFLIDIKITLKQTTGHSWSTDLYATSFLLAIGLGAHFFVGLTAVFALLYLGQPPQFRKNLTLPDLLRSAFCFGIGLTVFAYLPLRAGQVPASNWGDPDSWSNFWWVVSGQAYSGRFSWSHLNTFGGAVWRTLTDNLGIAGFLLACIGLATWWEKNRRLLIAASSVIILNIIWVAGYNSADILPYLLPSLMLLTLAIALITTNKEIHKQTQRFIRPFTIGAIGIIIANIYLGLGGINTVTTGADQYGRQITQTLPPQSAVITQSTAETFALRYARIITNPQTEIVHIDPNLYQWAWYRDDLAKQYPHVSFPLDDPHFDNWLQQLSRDNPQLTLYITAPETTAHPITYNSQLNLYQLNIDRTN